MAAFIPYSVLMPVAPWEPADQVAAALESIEHQTVSASQVVLSCDGEPAAPLVAVFGASSLPLKILVGPGKEGVGPVLARGLLACSCDLVVRADADDISLPRRCELQLEALAGSPMISAMSAFIEEFVSPDVTITGVRRVPVSAKKIFARSRYRNPLNHPAVVLRRSHVIDVGNYRACPSFEDYDLWLRLLRHRGPESISNLPFVLVQARVGADHLKRRHGWHYASREVNFFWRCGLEGLLAWPRVVFLLVLRPLTRLLPLAFLSILMRSIRNSYISGSANSYPQ